ncbi:MAG: hypothetical protein QXT77_00075 [Candidatus Methanomethylicaceae archaeon]
MSQRQKMRIESNGSGNVPSLESEAKKLWLDRSERKRVARLGVRYGRRFEIALSQELNALGLSLDGLRMTLGDRPPMRMTASALERILNCLALGQPLQGLQHKPMERMAAVVKALHRVEADRKRERDDRRREPGQILVWRADDSTKSSVGLMAK